MAAQEIPAIDAAGVTVLPVELEGITADRVGAGWARRRFIELQKLLRLRLGVAGLAALLFALFDAGGAGAGIAQPGEGPVAAVTVFPVDLHPGALGLEDANFGRGQGGFGKLGGTGF